MSRVPPHASGGSSPTDGEELEELEELGDDAIIAQQQGAHVPKPRVQVTEESRSIVISDHPPQGSSPPPATSVPGAGSGKRRSERTEKTVVIRDRRQIEELRREMAKRKAKLSAPPPVKGVWLWVIVGVAAFLTGGLVALFATRDDASSVPLAPIPSQLTAPAAPAPSAQEPPSVSIDELPIEGSKKH